jgi:hypothetical protein
MVYNGSLVPRAREPIADNVFPENSHDFCVASTFFNLEAHGGPIVPRIIAGDLQN